MSIINENNLNNYIREFTILVKEYKNNKNNSNIDTDITNKINIKLLNDNLNCNVISNIINDDNKKLQFKKEIEEKVIGSIITNYVEQFEIDKIFESLIKSLERQGSGLYNIITDPEQLELALDILTKGNLSVAMTRPITFSKLNYNLGLLNQGNLDMKKIWSGQAAIEIQQKIVSKSMDFTNFINKVMLSKNSNSLDVKKIAEYINEFKSIINKKFGEKERNLFTFLITDKENFSKVFSLIFSRLNVKMQNECNNLTKEDRDNFENILKSEVEYFNNNRITYMLKVIKNKLGDKFKTRSGSIIQNITGVDKDKFVETISQGSDKCLNNPTECQETITKGVKKVTDVSKKLSVFIK
jgi:hypothetical protein